MSAHHLKINPDKTELLLFPGKDSLTQDLTVNFGNSVLTPTLTAKNLGGTLDSQLSLTSNITASTRSCRYTLYNIRRIRPLLTQKAAQVLIQALVISRLDYCNSLLAGLPATAIRPLQLIQNAAARLVFSLPKFSHTTPLLRSLHWLPVAAPPYLECLCFHSSIVDRYVVIGAQRDAWGACFATSTVGTSLLVELARSVSDMVKNDGFKPRRSIVFASWSAGEYGSVGATEWLEVRRIYPTVLLWISSFYGVITLIAAVLLFKYFFPNYSSSTLYSQFAKRSLEPNLDDAAYPFLAFSGIPSVSFGFTSGNLEYPYFGTELDTREKLNVAAGNQVPQLAETAARFAGHMVLRLVHDHLLRMDVMKYNNIIRNHMQPQLLPKALTVQWLISASGSYGRVAQWLVTDMQNSDLEDIEMCRIINDRIMALRP
uniref:Transferrin receptor protein 1 n=1 Tax=Gasterosteus aculeatus aculeatus TaxID=481459 RepID=A0AAQ4PRX6_GASAC